MRSTASAQAPGQSCGQMLGTMSRGTSGSAVASAGEVTDLDIWGAGRGLRSAGAARRRAAHRDCITEEWDDLYALPRAAGYSRGGPQIVRALRRRVLAREGRRWRFPARVSSRDGAGRLARHRDADGLWRQRPWHLRGGGADAGGRRIGRRVFGRLGDPYEHLRPEPG